MKQQHWYQWVARRLDRRHWTPLLLGIVASIAVLGLWQQAERQEQFYLRQMTLAESNAVKHDLTAELETRIHALKRMATRWQIHWGNPQSEREIDAASYLRDFEGYQTIAWVDRSLQVRWILPKTGNEAAKSLYLRQEAKQLAALNGVRDRRKIIITPAVSIQPGETIFSIYTPLFIKNNFNGFIQIILQIESLFDRILHLPPGYSIRIYEGTNLIYKRGDVLPRSQSEKFSLKSYEINWEIEIFSTSKLLSTERSLLPKVILFGGLSGAWILALTVYLAQKSEHHARRARTINQQLQQEIVERQQIEANLRESEERWQLALRGNNDGIWDWNMQTNEIFYSTRCKEILGFLDSEHGKYPQDRINLLHPDDRDKVVQAVQDHLTKKTPFYISEHRIRCKNGNYKWILDRGQALWNDAGKAIRMSGSHTDITERKQAESELQELTISLENAVSGISKLDKSGRYLSVNRSYANAVGYEPEEMLGMMWQQTIHPDDVDKLIAAYYQMQQNGKVEAEARGLRKDGSIFYKQLVMISIYDEQHQFIGHHCFMKDVSDAYGELRLRKYAEEALQQSETRFQLFMNHSPAAAWISDTNGVIVYASQSYLKNFQLPTIDIVGKSIFEIFSSEFAQRFLENIQKVAQTQQVLEAIELAPRADGSLGQFLVYKFPLSETSRQTLVGGVAIDITERQQTEAAISQLAAIVESSEDAIISKSLDGVIESWNAGAERMFGYTALEVVGQSITKLIPANYVDEEAQILTIIRQEKSIPHYETVRQRKDGTLVNVSVSISLIKNKKGAIIGASKIVRDISDRKRRELELWQAMEAAESANLAKSTFLANMSHELRTPLNAILGFTQVMARNPALTPELQEDLQTIGRSGDYLLSLINDILDLSKIEAGHSALEEAGFDLIALLHSLQNMLAERVNSKKLQLYFDVAPNLPQFILADSQKLRQVLLNLLSNSLKFTDRGYITLRVRSEEPSLTERGLEAPKISNLDPTISNVTPKTSLLFEVTDTGVGISPQELDNIFDAFVQTQAGKRAKNGTGLGLTISRKLIEIMGGEIFVNSTPGQGSTFTFTVPVCPIHKVNIAPYKTDIIVMGLAPGQKQRRILVVDDRQENRLLIVKLLSQLGLEIREAANGKEAVKLWQEWQPDLTWMDIRMPVLDGYEATRQIRAMEENKNGIIIALTAQASQSDRNLALAAGCNDYISKPFREETLFIKMREYLGLEYLYAEPSVTLDDYPVSLSSSQQNLLELIAPTDLASLPQEWLDKLEDAAVCGNDYAIVELAGKLPPSLSKFGAYLIELGSKYLFEQILELLQSNSLV
ncbi:PAS domain S-box protein [Kamptonema animale CS-326]|uniref:PAS domain S-box protein n=1 Tax=Kamptonema animale TaxID=92934 RepID=UPI00232DCCAD|nr:PAS domain S-box protein [Kamptonema animale]MDB9511180.1 PAS domain S-box protein [Kamptonema animale CS-326]